ncbi:MAG: ABC transporter permease [Eubacteriales bacterium]|nr:ABC transporter permease [Eubacteriales bacterium]
MKKEKTTAILRTLTKRSFQRNRGRNLVAALAILLTTMMFTTLFTLAQSMTQNMEEMYLRQAGTRAHATSKQITDSQIRQIASHPDIVRSGRSIVVALAENGELAGRQVEIRYASDQYARDVFAYPVAGRMPERSDEIALDTLTLKRLGIPLIQGQPVTLEWRRDLTSSESVSSTFTLCGWWEGNLSSYASMAWVSEEFALEACDHVSAPADGQICGLRMMGITFADAGNIDAKTASVLSDCGLTDTEFTANLTYTAETRRSMFMENLPLYGGMVLVFLAGFLIIFNVFQISVASDILFYGKLKTLGATRRQISRVLYGQSARLSLTGIPAGLLTGYLFGILLVPVLITTADGNASVPANPVIFIGSALFAWITVAVSCALPARLAGKVSPIEALRYTDAATDSGRAGSRKRRIAKKRGAALSAMAWANLWRNRRRTALVLCSLTLGLVLMCFFYAKNASFDMEKYLTDLTVADYEIDDATNDLASGYDPESRTISEALLSDIGALGSLRETGRLYSGQAALTVSEQARANLQTFYTEDRLADFASYDPTFPAWKESFDAALAGKSVVCTVYGADGLILDAAADDRYLLSGSYDAEQFATGRYCLAIGPSVEPGSDLPTYSVGEKIRIADMEFEVMAVLAPLQPMVGGSQPAFDLPLVLPSDAFLQLWPDSNLRKFYFNTAEEGLEEAADLLTAYQQNGATGMNITSRRTMARQYEAQTRSAAVMGYAVSMIIALVGILNFINSMATALIARKREFAMLRSIGMTKRQLRRMLILEGLFYAGLTLFASLLLGSLAVGILVRGMVAGGYTTFHFTLLPLLLCAPVLTVFAILLPCLCFRNLEKQTIVERLRSTD